MKIAIVTPALGSAGGMGRVAEAQAAGLRGRGHEVTVFAPGSHSETKPRLRFGNAAWVPGLRKAPDGFDVVHLHYPFIGGAGALLRWKKHAKGAPLVVTYHMDLIGKGLLGPIFSFYSRLTTPRILKAADRILVSSKDYVEHSQFARQFRELAARVVEAPFGVDTTMFAPREPDRGVLDALGIAPEGSVILFVGGLDAAHYFKGVRVLIRAFALLRKEARHIYLVLVGRGKFEKEYLALAKRLGVGDAVRIANRVLGAELSRYYSIADVLALPSTTRSEAFGLVLLEAQASGVPVIASDLPGVRTVLENQKTGLLVPPNDHVALMRAMAWMCTHADERVRMGEEARRRIETRYRSEQELDALLAVYQALAR